MKIEPSSGSKEGSVRCRDYLPDAQPVEGGTKNTPVQAVELTKHFARRRSAPCEISATWAYRAVMGGSPNISFVPTCRSPRRTQRCGSGCAPSLSVRPRASNISRWPRPRPIRGGRRVLLRFHRRAPPGLPQSGASCRRQSFGHFGIQRRCQAKSRVLRASRRHGR